MKWITIFLAFLVCLVIGNILVLSFSPEYRAVVKTWQVQYGIGNKEFPSSSRESETKELSQSLEKMALGLSALSLSGSGNVSLLGSGSATQSGTGAQSFTGNLSIPLKKEYEIPGILLARLMPKFLPKKIENKGIFDIHIFESIDYTTYVDEKSGVKIFVFNESYTVMRSNLKLISGVYTINETDTFFDASFFLNPTSKNDSRIRFVTALDNHAIGFEMTKSQYTLIKKLLN